MGEQKDYLWVLPLIGGILTLIAFFTPAVFIEVYGESAYLWIWALLSYDVYDPYDDIYLSGAEFVDNLGILIPSIICSIFLILSILILIGSSLTYRSKVRAGLGNSIPWIVSSILIIIFTVAWIIAVDISWGTDPDFWDFWDPNFGIIGPFIGGGLGIVGFIAVKVSEREKREVIIIPQKIQTSVPQARPYSKIPMDSQVPVRFCPECGKKVVSENQKFCINCGFELRKL